MKDKFRVMKWPLATMFSFAFAGLGSSQLIVEDFESFADGSTVPNQTFTAETDQMNLMVATAGSGVNGSQGVVLDTVTANGNYRMADADGGVVGTFYQVKSKFQLTVNDLVPEAANHTIVSVGLSTQPEWWNGANINLSLTRRDGGKRFGLTGIGKDALEPQSWQITGWEANSGIGLPNELPLAGETATSDWFELVLTLESKGTQDAEGRELWDMKGQVLNSGGVVVFEHVVVDRVLTTNQGNPLSVTENLVVPGVTTLYPVVSVPWVDPDGGAGPISGNGYKTLPGGGVTGFVFDDVIAGGVSSDDGDADGDGYPNNIELTYGSDPLNAQSDPETIFSLGFTAGEGYVDTVVDDNGTPEEPADDIITGTLSGQNGWLGQGLTVVDTDGAGQICADGGYLRAHYGEGLRGGTGGVAVTDGDFETGRSIELVVDYSFTIDDIPSNISLAVLGFRPDSIGNVPPAQGFSMKYGAFAADSIGGSLRLFPDLKDEGRMENDVNVENDYAFFIDGHDVGVDPLNVLGNGVDTESDPLRITYVILAEDETPEDGFWDGLFTLQEFTVENLASGETFTFDTVANPRSFLWMEENAFFPYQDAFFALQFGRNNKGAQDCLDQVTVKNLLQDGILPEPTGDLEITDSGFVDADTFFIEFAPGGAGYKVTTAPGLDFANNKSDVTTTLAPAGAGDNRFEFDVTETSGYFRVEAE
ncbi:hypothetical protein [Roseibacillus persicicus]|uniref:hypothetical protein n=1 Tax=Roseibacillus persicicus TaxID=454148 RepID=UPI00280DDB9D|nr:hypothetical protein [Roseibacillus persicicus]MDQ8189667.1 hypothetical protein [Roseibacillus persicicus]